MPVKKNTRNMKKNEKPKRFSFFSDMDAEKKSNILKYSGVAVLVFALFTLVSVVSYLCYKLLRNRIHVRGSSPL